MENEIEDSFVCSICGESFDTEEAFDMHMDDHEMIIEQENLSKDDQEVLVTGLEMLVTTEELRLKRKYGYQIPICGEQLSKEDFSNREKELQIRDAMCRFHRIAQGEEEYLKGNLVITPKEKFSVYDYDLNLPFTITVKHPSEAHSERWVKKFNETPDTPEKVTQIIRGQFISEEETASQEELAANPYEKLTEKLWAFFEPAWNEKTTGSFDDAILLNVGKSIFRYMKCPSPECNFKVPKNLSQKEKYVRLMKHYLTEHLAKVHIKEREGLAEVDRFIESQKKADPMEIAKKAFTHPREEGDEEAASGPLMDHQTGAPNPEQCSKEPKYSDLQRALKESGRQPTTEEIRRVFSQTDDKTPKSYTHVESPSKKTEEEQEKEDKLLLAMELNSSEVRRQGLKEKGKKQESK